MKIGVELGIRAPQSAVLRAAEIADNNKVDYFFVPETHPNYFGVNAFDTLLELAEKTKQVTLGTGIVNVFSRTKEDILFLAEKVHSNSNGRFVLGIGTSAPVVIEKLWRMEFKQPLSRLKEYTEFLKENFSGRIIWAAVGEKTVRESAVNADGVLFFLKPKNQIEKDLVLVKESMPDDKEKFESLSILPVFFGDTTQAKMTIASYIGANEFYSKPLANAGLEEEVDKIKLTYEDFGLKDAAEKVSEKIVEKIAVCGNAVECAEKISEISKASHLDSIILGFDLAESQYTDNFFNELDSLLKNIK